MVEVLLNEKTFTVRNSLKKIYYCILFSRRQENSWKQHRGFITSFAPDQLSSFACVDNFAHLVWLFGGTFFLERISDQILVVTSPHLWKPVDPPPSLKVLNKWNPWQPISVPLKLLACLWVSLRFISVMLVLFLTVYLKTCSLWWLIFTCLCITKPLLNKNFKNILKILIEVLHSSHVGWQEQWKHFA